QDARHRRTPRGQTLAGSCHGAPARSGGVRDGWSRLVTPSGDRHDRRQHQRACDRRRLRLVDHTRGDAMNKLLTVAMTAMLGTGCMRSLMIQPGDSSALAASKVAVRVPLAVVTAGMTEGRAACVRNGARAAGRS